MKIACIVDALPCIGLCQSSVCPGVGKTSLGIDSGDLNIRWCHRPGDRNLRLVLNVLKRGLARRRNTLLDVSLGSVRQDIETLHGIDEHRQEFFPGLYRAWWRESCVGECCQEFVVGQEAVQRVVDELVGDGILGPQ